MHNSVWIFWAILASVASEDSKWAWNDDGQKTAKLADSRYHVHEVSGDLENLETNHRPSQGFRPQNPGPYGPDSRPFLPTYQNNRGVLVGPAGPTGVIGRPHRPDHTDFDNDDNLESERIQKDSRYREYDTCKCRYSFNCPSNGLKFGVCSENKRYCCYNSKRLQGSAQNYQREEE